MWRTTVLLWVSAAIMVAFYFAGKSSESGGELILVLPIALWAIGLGLVLAAILKELDDA